MERLIGMPNIEQNLIKMLERPEIQVFLDNGLYNEALVGIMNLCDAVDADLYVVKLMQMLSIEGISLKEMLDHFPVFEVSEIELHERLLDTAEEAIYPIYKMKIKSNPYYKLLVNIFHDVADYCFNPVAVITSDSSIEFYLDFSQDYLVETKQDNENIKELKASEETNLQGVDNYILYDCFDMDKLKSQMQEVLYSYWLDKWNNVILKNKTDDIEGFYD